MKKSNKEVKELTSKRKKELKTILKAAPGFCVQGDLGRFFDNYLVCESLAKKIVLYGSNKESKSESNTLRWNILKNCMITFNLLDEKNSDFIKKVFSGGKGKRGEKTSRQLRNGYIHGLNEKDKEEIEERSSELIDLMEKFKNKFKSL